MISWPHWHVFLLIVTALAYGGATIGMKLASGGGVAAGLLLIATGFIAAAGAEVILMKSEHLGQLYFSIIAIETIIVIAYAQVIGEGLSPRDCAGGVCILLGLLLVRV